MKNLHKYGYFWNKMAYILISESSELAGDNAADGQVTELRRGMRACPVSPPLSTLHTACPWLGVPRQDHLHGAAAVQATSRRSLELEQGVVSQQCSILFSIQMFY